MRHERFIASVAEPKKSWLDRSELASLFIREGDTVCDLGCGVQGLKRFLPANTGYIPIDRDISVQGTFHCDFNDGHFTLPTYDFNVIVALGLLNWLNDLDHFMMRLTELCPDRFIIFTYDFWKSRENAASALSELHEGTSFFSKHVRNLTLTAGQISEPAR